VLLLRTLGFWLLALHVLIVPQGLSLSFCTAHMHGWWSDAEVVAEAAYACSDDDEHEHEHEHEHDHADRDAEVHRHDRSSDLPDEPLVDLPACPGCQSVVFDDGLPDSVGVRVPQVDAPVLDPFVLLEPPLPEASRLGARSAPPGAVRSTGRLPGTLPLRV
jgi:hypothetical protein